MSKVALLRSVFICLSVLLLANTFLPTLASAHSTNVSTENAIEILEAMDSSSVIQPDGSVLFNEDQLEKELEGNSQYEELKVELNNAGLLTDQDMADVLLMAAASNVNPKWTAARDACAKKYLKDEFSLQAVTGILTFLYAGQYSKAIKELAKKGIKFSLPGLVALYGHMNYVCIKEANSKHKVYG